MRRIALERNRDSCLLFCSSLPDSSLLACDASSDEVVLQPPVLVIEYDGVVFEDCAGAARGGGEHGAPGLQTGSLVTPEYEIVIGEEETSMKDAPGEQHGVLDGEREGVTESGRDPGEAS